ncbi:4Fe-4S binding protein [Bradyrhizobium sp. AUGA SZCCT0240]|nr:MULTISPECIES: 4Fe-4S binding protein [unclassified Bradyrhizobium]MBR1194728.1 4Fe-4S binding protein [Bradyrhizobium sp. AUGA SZCCT0158]MBR1239256.1 4Fe-4S binding protein [Bradyrhizobium sp. AUGA SZCCT0274]MBR1254239.1 4Fe-4S binding protein [Bradyrhizobium sp. AUGA SZCCT0240]
MATVASHLLICSCEKTMPLDVPAINRGCAGKITQANQLCGLELERFKQALADGAPITVACTQEAPLFREVAEDFPQAQLTFANIREAGGWSNDAAAAGPKAAALIAAAQEEMPPISMVTLESSGVALIYGRDEVAIDAAQRLADRLDITVLLSKPGDVTPRRSNEFPVLKGTIRNARGHLGAFELGIDDYALPLPSSRAKLVFGPARNGATSTCDLILDLSGGTPLFPAHELRPGYLRADPRDRAAVERAIADAGNLVGTFDKPRFIQFEEALCAHSRSGITGCTRCLDLCPTGAITPNGKAVAIDANVCAGCGACASVCPTGAASYALPSADALMRRLRTLLQTYRKAGGSNAIVLFHDGEHGDALIDALARFGAGLPAHVLPLRVNEVTQLGPESIAAVFAYGGCGVAILTRGKPRHDIAGLHRTAGTSDTVVAALGFGAGLVRILETDDPDQLRAMLDAAPGGVATPKPAGFVPRGAKRGVLETTFRELHLAAPAPVDSVPLAPGAPFGGVNLNVEGCTLCHACVTACPTGALSDNPDRAMLRFTESLCVQCGLCEATCPEKVITLEPRLDFAAWNAPLRVLKEEEPFNCIACGKPFGTKSSIERVLAKLGEKHWMFQGANAKRIDVIKMCADCRVEAVVNEGFDPHGAPQRPPVMSTEDYLRARDGKKGDPVGS